ncbi:hypothetical protein [Streptomyces sp. DSM 40750]|uniref:hypothetical protein n=1 Tax=Streptomyces sp. DSM 40750 TaxID=2801030 RepID=UPI00214C9255|nr:hypothetical protein [Streptomyces sp. DSM 40750]UUU21907.1 hypothetical protein JIX55_17100 [Streptomyces sp. DSM 40750]
MHQPITTHRAPLPVLRAAVFSVVGTVVGVSAHHLLAQGPVPWAPCSVAAAALFGLGLVGTRRPRQPATVMTSSVVAQSGLHLWLSFTARTPHATAEASGHQHGQAHSVHAAWHERLHDSLAMTVAHALVAVFVALLLHQADAACWAVALARGATATVDTVRATLTAAWTVIAGRPRKPEGLGLTLVLPVEGEPPAPMAPALAHAVVRRGPPSTWAVLVN